MAECLGELVRDVAPANSNGSLCGLRSFQDAEGVVQILKVVYAMAIRARDAKTVWATTSRYEQGVVRNGLALIGRHRAALRIYGGHPCAQAQVNAPLFVCLDCAKHYFLLVDSPFDEWWKCDPVVERVRLVTKKSDAAVRVSLSECLGGRGACDAISDDDVSFFALSQTEPGLGATAPKVTLPARDAPWDPSLPSRIGLLPLCPDHGEMATGPGP